MRETVVASHALNRLRRSTLPCSSKKRPDSLKENNPAFMLLRQPGDPWDWLRNSTWQPYTAKSKSKKLYRFWCPVAFRHLVT
jgi:hypothetical protein